jgi:hypothetical protein
MRMVTNSIMAQKMRQDEIVVWEVLLFPTIDTLLVTSETLAFIRL